MALDAAHMPRAGIGELGRSPSMQQQFAQQELHAATRAASFSKSAPRGSLVKQASLRAALQALSHTSANGDPLGVLSRSGSGRAAGRSVSFSDQQHQSSSMQHSVQNLHQQHQHGRHDHHPELLASPHTNAAFGSVVSRVSNGSPGQCNSASLSVSRDSADEASQQPHTSTLVMNAADSGAFAGGFGLGRCSHASARSSRRSADEGSVRRGGSTLTGSFTSQQIVSLAGVLQPLEQQQQNASGTHQHGAPDASMAHATPGRSSLRQASSTLGLPSTSSPVHLVSDLGMLMDPDAEYYLEDEKRVPLLRNGTGDVAAMQYSWHDGEGEGRHTRMRLLSIWVTEPFVYAWSQLPTFHPHQGARRV